MKHSWSLGRAVVSKTLIFRKVCCKVWSWKALTKQNVWQISESRNTDIPVLQTFFNYKWTSVAHKGQSVIELKVYACHDWEGFPILAKGRSQGRVPGVLESPLLGYENGYHFKRKKVSERPFRNSARRHFRFWRGTNEKQFKKASHAISHVVRKHPRRLLLSDILAEWTVNHKSAGFDEVCNMLNNYYIIQFLIYYGPSLQEA